MSETNSPTSAPAAPTAAGASPAPAAAPATPATPVQAPAGDPIAAMRALAIRSMAVQILGAPNASWVLDAALSQVKPELAPDLSGLAADSLKALQKFKSDNPFGWASAAPVVAAPAAAAPAAAPAAAAPAAAAAAAAPAATAPAVVLPATPSSAEGAATQLTTEQIAKLRAAGIDPARVTKHPDVGRLGAIWGLS